MDKVVSATQFRDFIVVVTERGVIYRVLWSEYTSMFEIQKMAEITLK